MSKHKSGSERRKRRLRAKRKLYQARKKARAPAGFPAAGAAPETGFGEGAETAPNGAEYGPNGLKNG